MKRGWCPACGRLIALRKDGRLRIHGYRMIEFASGPNCSGSGKLPMEIEGYE